MYDSYHRFLYKNVTLTRKKSINTIKFLKFFGNSIRFRSQSYRNFQDLCHLYPIIATFIGWDSVKGFKKKKMTTWECENTLK